MRVRSFSALKTKKTVLKTVLKTRQKSMNEFVSLMKERFDVNDVDDKNILFRFEPEIILDSVFFWLKSHR